MTWLRVLSLILHPNGIPHCISSGDLLCTICIVFIRLWGSTHHWQWLMVHHSSITLTHLHLLGAWLVDCILYCFIRLFPAPSDKIYQTPENTTNLIFFRLGGCGWSLVVGSMKQSLNNPPKKIYWSSQIYLAAVLYLRHLVNPTKRIPSETICVGNSIIPGAIFPA